MARYNLLVLTPLLMVLAGCGSSTRAERPETQPIWNVQIDAQKLRAADMRVLFIGNSHSLPMPELVTSMIQARQPGKSLYVHSVFTGSLDAAGNDQGTMDCVAGHPWTHVILQGQMFSMSGRHSYPRRGGIEIAMKAKTTGAKVCYLSEWGSRGVEGDGRQNERTYQMMAEAAGVHVAPVGRAWEMALAERPELVLHAGDGNHQNSHGAFLSGCVLYSQITGDDAGALGSVPYADVSAEDRTFLASIAAQVMKARASTGQSNASPCELPLPTGRYPVGTRPLYLRDPKRAEMVPTIKLEPGLEPTAQAAAGERQVEVQLWFPASAPVRAGESALYNFDLEALARWVKDPGLITAQRRLRTMADPTARVADEAGALPVVLLAPGSGSFVSDYTALAQELASHGYLVAVVASPGVNFMRRGAGLVSGPWEDWQPRGETKRDRADLEAQAESLVKRDRVVAADLALVLDDLATLNETASSVLHQRIDMKRVAAMGHGSGGCAAACAAADQRISALAVFDAFLPPTHYGNNLRPPLLLVRPIGTDHRPALKVLMLAPFTTGRCAGLDVAIDDARHESFSDQPFQLPERFAGTTPASRVAELHFACVRAFLDRHLRELGNGLPAGAKEGETVVTVYDR